jgi:hypothetical protein
MTSHKKAIKLDYHRMSACRGAKKRAATKRPGRGADLVIHGRITTKRDPFLQQRIDMVVKNALRAQQSGHSTDVINGYHTLRFHSSGLKCHRVG